MKKAKHSDGSIIIPTLEVRTAVCWGCGETVFAKCGSKMDWHWCHRSGSACVQAGTEPMTDWHKDWQGEVPSKYREVSVRRNDRTKRADIKAKTKTVIELQHSPIANGEVADREGHYGLNMFWMYDSDSRSRSINKTSAISGLFEGLPFYQVRLNETVPGLLGTTRPKLVDLHDDVCRVVPHLNNSERCFYAAILPAEDVRGFVAKTCDEDEPFVDPFLMDTRADWMSGQQQRNAKKNKGRKRGRYTREYCPHIGEMSAPFIERQARKQMELWSEVDEARRHYD